MSTQQFSESTSADHYSTLGISAGASSSEIKAAYRRLVKQHHPDAGGDSERILALNAAWEVLGDAIQREAYDVTRQHVSNHLQQRGARNARASAAARTAHGQSAAADDALLSWLRQVYSPIDRLLGEVIKPFPAELRALSADPYDDALMEAFCLYLEKSRQRLKKVNDLYQRQSTPDAAIGFSLSLYQCLSEVEDALVELERYTMGYVDSYLRDGREMMREAKQRRSLLHQERRSLSSH